MSEEVIIDGKDGWEIYKTPGKYYEVFAYNKIIDKITFPKRYDYDVLAFNNKNKENIVCDLKKLHIGNNYHKDFIKRQENIIILPFSAYRYTPNGLTGLFKLKHKYSIDISLYCTYIMIKLNEIGLSDVKVKFLGKKQKIRLDFKDELQVAQFNFYFGQYFV
jgi:hypothetical protein